MSHTTTSSVNAHTFIQGVHGVRYQVKMSLAPWCSIRSISVSRLSTSNRLRSRAYRSEIHTSC